MTRAKCVASLFQRSIRVTRHAEWRRGDATSLMKKAKQEYKKRTILQVADSLKHSIRANRAAEALAAAAKRAAEALTIACMPQSVPTDSNCGQASAGAYPAALRAHHTSKAAHILQVLPHSA